MTPEPKFKLGQEVVWNGKIEKINGVFERDSNGVFYTLKNFHYDSTFPEKELSLPKRKVKAYCFKGCNGHAYTWVSDGAAYGTSHRIPAMDFEVEVSE